jgi:hypothetical protein
MTIVIKNKSHQTSETKLQLIEDSRNTFKTLTSQAIQQAIEEAKRKDDEFLFPNAREQSTQLFEQLNRYREAADRKNKIEELQIELLKKQIAQLPSEPEINKNTLHSPTTEPTKALDSAENEGKGKRNKQVNVILKAVINFEYDPLNIPEGGKAKIKKECLKNKSLFTESAFKRAWIESGRRGLIRMKDKEKYL